MYNKRQLYKHIIKNISKSVKLYIDEAFDFENIGNKKKHANIYDILLKDIVDKIIDNKKLDKKECTFILSLKPGSYKTNDGEIKQLVKNSIKIFGRNCNLNWIDTSAVTNMHALFSGSFFNGDISEWDVSNVRDMSKMFNMSNFNGDISRWNVGNVQDMEYMFYGAIKFNGDISHWDVSNVKNMKHIFRSCPLASNQPKWYSKEWNKYLKSINIVNPNI